MADIPVQEDVTKLTYSQLYRMLVSNEDIVMFIKVIDLDRTKRGISNAKTRESDRDKDLGFDVEKERISFQELVKTEEETKKYGMDTVKLQVSLVRNSFINVLSVKTLSGEEL